MSRCKSKANFNCHNCSYHDNHLTLTAFGYMCPECHFLIIPIWSEHPIAKTLVSRHGKKLVFDKKFVFYCSKCAVLYSKENVCEGTGLYKLCPNCNEPIFSKDTLDSLRDLVG